MYRLKKHIAFVFLFLIAGISLPKSWIHHCSAEPQKVSNHSKDTLPSSEHKEEECAVCAFELGTMAREESAPVAFVVEFLTELYSEEVTTLHYTSPITSQNKAPPLAKPAIDLIPG